MAESERKGWLRLLIESVDVPLDLKDPHRLCFATVQSLIPGAHGLYYRGEDGRGSRRALAFDGTGYVLEPEDGWTKRDIYVHLAHGHRSGPFGCGAPFSRAVSLPPIEGIGEESGTVTPSPPLDAYSAATERFERTVTLVQKMLLAQSASIPPRSSRKSSGASNSVKIQQQQSQTSPTQQHSSTDEHSEAESSEVAKQRLLADNETLTQRLAECSKELEETREKMCDIEFRANKELDHLREAACTAESRLEEAERMAEGAHARAAEMESALMEAQARLTYLEESVDRERQRAEKAEWSLGEHRAWLSDANQRAAHASGCLEAAHLEKERLFQRAQEAEWKAGELEAALNGERTRASELDGRVQALQREVQEAKDRVPEVVEERVREALKTSNEEAEKIKTELEEKLAAANAEIQRLGCELAAQAREEEFLVRTIEKEEAAFERHDEILTAEVERRIAETREVAAAEVARAREEAEAAVKHAAEEAHRVKDEVEARCLEAQQKLAEIEAELERSKKRIHELMDKEEELNNLHDVIEELRRSVEEAEKARAAADWHLGEHRDWLKNERDKVAFLEEQVRRATAGEAASNSRPVSRKNSTESGVGSMSATNADHHERSGSESPPEKITRMKLSAAPDDLALEMMALSKAKQRMAEQIRELKQRPDPAQFESERRQAGETIRQLSEKCARLEEETARHKDTAARVNLETFAAQSDTISRLQGAVNDAEWKLGEHRQALSDARWRIGELESEIRVLRERAAGGEESDGKIQNLERALSEACKAKDDALWRLGEIEAELGRVRAQSGNGGGGASTEELSRAWERVHQLEGECSAHKWRIGELEAGYAHHEWLLSQRPSRDEVDGLRGRIADLERQLGEAHKAADDAKWRCGELEAALHSAKQQQSNSEEIARLRAEKEAAEKRVDELQREWHAHKWRIGELESGYAHHEWLLSQREEEIKGLNARIAELNGQIEEANRRNSDHVCAPSNSNDSEETRKRLEQLQSEWHAQKWRIGELEAGYAHHEWLLSETRKKEADARHRVAELEGALHKAQRDRESEQPGQLSECVRDMRVQNEALERRCAELAAAFNDMKWRNGELDSTVAWLRSQVDDDKAKMAVMEQRHSLEGSPGAVERDGSFVVRHRRASQPTLWQMSAKTTVDDTSDLRPVTLTIDEPSESDAVFVIGGFSSWECCARLQRDHNGNGERGKRTATLHLPKGRHEFRFIVNGGWANSAVYPTVANPFGTTNNWIVVE